MTTPTLTPPPAEPHDEMLAVVKRLASTADLQFDAKARLLEAWVEGQSAPRLEALLAAAGFIPEEYEHDSSDEKLYAKAMDVLVAVCLRRIGYDAQVSQERSNSADVAAILSAGQPHSMVLDAKAFRLSRTALNPKDYKISALNTWRKGADFAVLVGPLAGFPEGSSRLFGECGHYGVTLVTYSHLAFLLHTRASAGSLRTVWDAARTLPAAAHEPNAREYWLHLDKVFCEACAAPLSEWAAYRQKYFTTLLSVAKRQVSYYQSLERRIRAMPHDELATLAIKALKIDGRIATIEQRALRTQQMLDEIGSDETRS